MIRNSWLKLRFALAFLHIFNYVLVHGRTANFSFSLLSATCAYLMGGFYFPRESALFMLLGVMPLVPLILAYTAFIYWTFRGKIKTGDTYY